MTRLESDNQSLEQTEMSLEQQLERLKMKKHTCFLLFRKLMNNEKL